MTEYPTRKSFLCSIIIPAYNEEKYIRACLESLCRQSIDREKYEILVIDNGSIDNTVSIANEYSNNVEVHPKINVGAVRNKGAEIASSDMLIFIDSDCVVDSNWLERAMELASNTKYQEVFGGTLRLREKPGWIEKYWLLENDNPKRQRHLVGGCIIMSKHIFQEIGGFNVHMTSGEDSDLSIRLENNGTRVNISNNVSVVHLGNATDIITFLKRQAWHSENYFKFLFKSLRDPTFYIIMLFALSVLGLASEMATSGISLGLFAYLVPLSIAILLTSAKRLYSRQYLPRPAEIIPIIILDMLYLSGRLYGSLRGLVKILPGNPRSQKE